MPFELPSSLRRYDRETARVNSAQPPLLERADRRAWPKDHARLAAPAGAGANETYERHPHQGLALRLRERPRPRCGTGVDRIALGLRLAVHAASLSAGEKFGGVGAAGPRRRRLRPQR